MRHLIVTADDLGLTKSINEGIAMAYRDGIVRSISAIPTGEAFEDAIRVMKDLALDEIGAHLALTETKPLLSSSGFYKNHNRFFIDLLIGRISLNNIYKELKAQIDLLNKSGIRITHINSHEHIHIIPALLDIFIRIAKEYNIPAIRYPRGDRQPKKYSPSETYRSFLLSYFSGKNEGIFEKSGLIFTDFFLGLLDAGRLDEKRIIGMLKDLKEGVTEIVTHPGFLSPEVLSRYSWHRSGETELFALTGNKVKNAVRSNDIKLIKYGEFLSIKR